MATVTTDPTPLLEQLAGGFEVATEQVLAAVEQRQRKRTGALAASYTLQGIYDDGQGWWANVASTSPYALPVERGAYLRGRRGPHMRGNFIVRKTGEAVFRAAMTEALPVGYKPRRTRVTAHIEKLGA